MSYYFYLLRCADDTLYAGVTTDLARREREHNGLSGRKGARYTRSRRPVKIVHVESYDTRSQAQKREWEVKKMTRGEKERITDPPLEI